MSLNRFLSDVGGAVSAWTDKFFKVSENALNYNLYNSMRYSLNAGGKKLRPALVILGYNLVKDTPVSAEHPAIPFAAGVEMIHTYSLVHDDLPGMDNDDTRRGKPTNHMVYGEAVAILAGDGLLTKAFEIFLNPEYYSGVAVHNYCRAAFEIAAGTGPDGMVGGQYVDMAESADMPYESALRTDKPPLDILKYIHLNKTAKFIAKSLKAGVILAGGDDGTALDMERFGMHIGLAFQIADDILDITSTTQELGKPAGSDDEMNKATYPKLMGLDESMRYAGELIHTKALGILSGYDCVSAKLLEKLALYIIDRRS